MTSKFISGALALALTGAMAGAAFAQDSSLRYRDLDLSTTEGAATFRARVDAAGRAACEDQRNLTGSHISGTAECRREFQREVERQLPSTARAALSGTEVTTATTTQ